MDDTNANRLARAAGDYGIHLTSDALVQFMRYSQELLWWNAKINLVSLKTPDDLWTKHFLDSLYAGPCIPNKMSKLLDLGTGAGFPGLPLKIAFPALRLYLVESSRKKSSFLKQIIRRLALQETTVINKRLEDLFLNDSLRHAFDVVISRAAFKLPDLLRYAAYFLGKNGILIAMKGSNVLDQEMVEAEMTAPAVGMAYLFSKDIETCEDGRRIIVVYKRY